ncbi:activator-dependent family glycosyltransferase [Actinoplanes sp. NEAU-A12]|uniref:Activator-dependent family glycosyltransferase n=1 Tax=Actinoplanes sandaracinus TaxID=3045177 RepID=A0ABT6WZI9_9ACTN|nr:activator-dependent family glycosyltransferase [Actinoplanes sandaracinus]MDI6105161.1 activator-dependent family glycosyltransferase [Actinoplanes sandaracinus]
MRVLFTAKPETAHLLAMVPLAWAMRTAGHEVRFASQPGFADAITRAGLTAVGVGRDTDVWQLSARYPSWPWAMTPDLPVPYDTAAYPERATWQHLSDGYADVLKSWHKPVSFPMIAGLVEFAREWEPDLVIWEPTAYAGPIAAKACGAVHARLLWSMDVFGVTRDHFLRVRGDRREDPFAEWLGSYGAKYGFEFSEDMTVGQFTIDQIPGSLRMAADLHYEPMRFVPYGGAAEVPKWLWTKPAESRVALTMGLSATDHGMGYAVSAQEVLDALADLDVEVVATIAEAEQGKLGRLPGNARVLSYVPLQALAPTCSAVISHGGFGTMLTTALHGVPQLALPWDFDGPAFIRRATAQGATLAVPAAQATAGQIRDNVQRLLHEPVFRARAAQLRDEMYAMPTPHQLVPRLEELTVKYRTAAR